MTAAHPLSLVYREHHAFVWRTLRCLGVADAAIDDAVQDVFVVVHRRLGEFEGRSTLQTWLYQIARRVAWRYRKRAQADAVRNFELPDLHAALDLEDAVARAQALEILRAFLGSLDEDKATVYVLTELGGLRGSEIAQALDINVNTVHARLRAARRELGRMVTRLRARDRSGAVPRPERIASALATERPPAEQRQRSWALIVGQLGLARSSPWMGLTAATAKWVAGAMVVSTTVVLSAVIVQTPAPAVPAARSSAAKRTPPADLSPQTPPPTPSLASLELVAPTEPPTPIPPPRLLVPATPKASPDPRTDPPPDPPRRPAPTEPPTAAPTSDALSVELAMVESIRRARLDDATRALLLIGRYRGAHPSGALASEVDALEVEALCTAGRVDAARRASARFAESWPSSSLRPVATSCKLTSR